MLRTARLRRPTRLVGSVGAALALGALVVACSSAEGGDEEPVTTAAPTQEFPVLGKSGETFALSELTSPTLVNVWATWCVPCREEMPLLEEFGQEHAGAMEVFGVNYQDQNEDEALTLVEETGVSYPSVRDFNGDVSRNAGFPFVRGLPMMVLIDEGEVVGHKFFIAKTVEDIEEFVEETMPGVLDEAQGDARG